jgi:hypothetical protein
MLRRAAILALLVFQSAWLNIVLPGHTRGVVTLGDYRGGAKSQSCHVAEPTSCCAGGGTSAAAESQDASDDSKKPAERGRESHCAVCFFATKVSLPPAIDLTLAPLGLAEVRPVPICESAASVAVPLVYHGRAPPVC